MASSAWFAEAARSARPPRSALHGGVAGTLLAICALASGGFPAHAADGVVEINQTCATVSGCFAGDDPGFPVQIVSGGSYRLTSHIDVGAGGIIDAISISGAPGVSLDLGGFTISGAPGVEGAGISGSTDAVHVFDGVVTGFAPDGTLVYLSGASSVLERVRTTGAIDVGAGGVVRDCIAQGSVNVGAGGVVEDSVVAGGIFPQSGARVEGSLVRGAPDGIQGSGEDGVRIARNVCSESSSRGALFADGALVEGNLFYASGLDGIACGQGCFVWDNAVIGSSGAGVELGPESLYRANALIDNGTPVDAANPGTVGSGNYCSGPGTLSEACP